MSQTRTEKQSFMYAYQGADDGVRDESDKGAELIEDSEQHQHDPEYLPHDPTGHLKHKQYNVIPTQ